MDRKMLALGLLCAFIFVLFDFFTRVILLDPEVNVVTRKSTVLPSFSRVKINVDDFINKNFTMLVEEKRKAAELKKAQEDKINQQKSQQKNTANAKTTKSQKTILRTAKLVGVITKNGLRKAVVEYKNNKGKKVILTLQQGQKIAEGKIKQIGRDYIEIDIQGEISILPLFKNKNITFSG